MGERAAFLRLLPEQRHKQNLQASPSTCWYDGGCSDDRQKVRETCQRIGLNEPEAKGLFVERSKEACTVMDKTDVWRAVLTLAERLPDTDRMPGDIVVSIVQNALRAR